MGLKLRELRESKGISINALEKNVSLPPCEWCGESPRRSRRGTPYCRPCESRIRATERLRVMNNPLAPAFYQALMDARITLHECCLEIGFSRKTTFWEWMAGGKIQLHKLLILRNCTFRK